MAHMPKTKLRCRAALCSVPLAALLSGPALISAQTPVQKSATAPPAAAQSPSAKPSLSGIQNAPEMTTRDTKNAFKVRVNLVLVRVVVRDDHGNVVKNLRKEDFLLFDNRKPQTITSFTVETPTSHVVPVTTPPEQADAASSTPAQTPRQVALPDRFVALLFDDIHLKMVDAVTVRDAATRIFDALGPSDRVAIFTTSGQFHLDFTSDREALRRALLNIIPHPVGNDVTQKCPDIDYYMADRIINKGDQQALELATLDTLRCMFQENGSSDRQQLAAARQVALTTATTVLASGDAEAGFTFRHIEDAIRRLDGMPGQRTLVYISPGFEFSFLADDTSRVVDQALRAKVIVDSIDARGLYTPAPLGDVSVGGLVNPQTVGQESSYRLASQFLQGDVLAQFAYGTGGTYFHNRNDLDVGLRKAVIAPPVSYLLSFSPQNLKLNGAYHKISVKLAMKNNYSIEARRGYYAPRTLKNPAEQAKTEIQEAVFSQDELHDFPIELQTQFFKKDETDAQLSVLAHVDMKTIPFQKADGRNRDDLTLATAIFDENGNFVTGNEKILEMRLFDTTLTRVQQQGITVKTSFDVKPGSYLVRLVVRDAQGEEMAARNGAVVIPY
jgi:VWFA-related protein